MPNTSVAVSKKSLIKNRSFAAQRQLMRLGIENRPALGRDKRGIGWNTVGYFRALTGAVVVAKNTVRQLAAQKVD